jgi:hypothetical protein
MGSTAARISPVWDDPTGVADFIRPAGPFWPLPNFAANDAATATLGRERVSFTPPWIPQVNVMGPTPFTSPPHLDIPAFRGSKRATWPASLLKSMKTSGLFEAWRPKFTAGVSRFYAGLGVDFNYWPNGPDGTMAPESLPYTKVSVLADSEFTFHGVAPVGPPEVTMPDGPDRHPWPVRGESGWDVHDPVGGTQAHFGDDEVPTTVSWKAQVFTYADEAEVHDPGDDAPTLDTVVNCSRRTWPPVGLRSTCRPAHSPIRDGSPPSPPRLRILRRRCRESFGCPPRMTRARPSPWSGARCGTARGHVPSSTPTLRGHPTPNPRGSA